MTETLTPEEQIAQAIVLAPHLSARTWAVARLSGQNRTAGSAREAAWAVAAVVVAWAAAAAVVWAAAVVVVVALAAVATAAAVAAWVEEKAEEAKARRWAATVVAQSPEPLRQPALVRARAILVGAFPADRYDEELSP